MVKEVTRSNPKLPLPYRSRSVLREKALAAWRLQPSDRAKDLPARNGNRNEDLPGLPAWIFEDSRRDMEIVTRALVTELNSRPNERVITRISNEKNAGPSSSTSSCDPGSPSQTAVDAKASASLEVSDSMEAQSEAPGTRTETLSISCNNQRSIPGLNNFIGKRRSRRGNKAPITRADPADFQVMAQQMMGFPLENNSRAASSLSASSVLKPQPEQHGPDFTESD